MTGLLFSHYFKFNIGMLAVAKIYRSFVSTQFLYIVCNMDLLPVNLISFLIADGTTNLKGRNTTEDLSACTGFSTNLYRSFLQFGNNVVDLRKHLVFFLFSNFHSFVELLTVRRILSLIHI